MNPNRKIDRPQHPADQMRNVEGQRALHARFSLTMQPTPEEQTYTARRIQAAIDAPYEAQRRRGLIMLILN